MATRVSEWADPPTPLLLVLTSLAIFSAGCVTARSAAYYPAAGRSPTPIAPVQVYYAAPPRPFERLGEVEAHGAPLASWESVAERLREEAAKLGGDAVVVTGRSQEYRMTSPQWGPLFAKRIVGVVIRFTTAEVSAPPSSRVGGSARPGSLTGTYTGLISGTQGGRPFSVQGRFEIVHEDDQFSGTWRTTGGTAGEISGTAAGPNRWTVRVSQLSPCPGEFAGDFTVAGEGAMVGGSYVGEGCGQSVQASVAATRDGPAASRRTEESTSVAGTGFIVNAQGDILTTNHVVEDCAVIRSKVAEAPVTLNVQRRDRRNDLAVLRAAPPLAPTGMIAFREGRGIRPGDGVLAIGFPLAGLLATEVNVTTGVVSALAGPGDDTRLLQMTAPVQSGSSGGPLLDMSGHVVGMVVAKLSALRVARETGTLPENVNFALHASVIRTFLDANDVDYTTAASTDELKAAAIAAKVRGLTLPIECQRRSH